MPNHVVTRMSVNGNADRISEMFDSIHSEGSRFDFNRVIPMPDDLQIESDGFVMMLNNKYTQLDPLITLRQRIETATAEQVDNFCKALHNVRKYGAADWYEWACRYWGTKWNAYEVQKLDENTIQFQTAWEHPQPIMIALSKKFADLLFRCDYADEDIGRNVAYAEYHNGFVYQKDLDGTDEGKQLACELHGRDYQRWIKEI